MLCCLKGGSKMSILEQLFNGKIFPAEACVPKNEIFKTAVSNMKKAEEKFEEGITKEQKNCLLITKIHMMLLCPLN